MQWFVLRRRVSRAGWWVLATPVGNALGSFISVVSPALFFQLLVGAPARGAITGAAQWLVLRRQVHGAGWWVLASILGAFVGGLVALLGPRELAGGEISSMVPVLVGVEIAATIAASAVTGIALAWLLERPHH
jgi:hypothetical protein